MDESRRKELELRLARLQDEKERRVSAPDEPSPVDAALEIEGDEDGWMEDFGEGIAASIMKTGYGIADLVGGVGEGTFQLDPERLADMQEDAKDSGFGTAGNVVGEIGQFLLGGGLIAKGGLKAAKMAKAAERGSGQRKALRKAVGAIGRPGLVREASIAGGLGGLQYAGENESRAGNAITNAALVGAGGLALKGAAKAFKGAEVTKSAKKAMERGDYLTPGQAVKGGLVRALENVMGVLPGLASGVVKARSKGVNDWATGTLTGFTNKLGMKAPKRFDNKAAQDIVTKFDENANAAWNKAKSFSPADDFGKIITKVIDSKRLNADGDAEVAKILSRLFDPETGKKLILNKNELRVLYDDLGNLKGSNKATNDTMSELRQTIRNKIGKEAGDEVKVLNDIYPDYKTVKTALQNVPLTEGPVLITPKMLDAAAKTVSRKGQKRATQDQSFATATREGVETVERGEPGVLFDLLKGVAQTIPSPDKAMEVAGRAVLGQTKVQQIAQPAIRRMEEYSRALRRKGGVGGSAIFPAMEQ